MQSQEETLSGLFLNSQKECKQRPAQGKPNVLFQLFPSPGPQAPRSQVLSHEFLFVFCFGYSQGLSQIWMTSYLQYCSSVSKMGCSLGSFVVSIQGFVFLKAQLIDPFRHAGIHVCGRLPKCGKIYTRVKSYALLLIIKGLFRIIENQSL